MRRSARQAAKNPRFPSPPTYREDSDDGDTIVVQTEVTTLATSFPLQPVTPRGRVKATKSAEKAAPRLKMPNSGYKEEDIMDILSRPPPPDPEEWLSRVTQAARRANPSSYPLFAPLLSGTSTAQQPLIRQELINLGAKFIPKAGWRKMLLEQGIHKPGQVVADTDIKFNLWLETCVPAHLLPADKGQWCHLHWLMDVPLEANPHPLFAEAQRVGDFANMLYYEDAQPGRVMPTAGIAKDPLVLDAPGEGGPFDALRGKNRERLVDFLNTREFWNEHGWTEEALARIPGTMLTNVRPSVIAKFPHSVIKKLPVRMQNDLPENAPFWLGDDGLPIWEEARKAAAADQDVTVPEVPVEQPNPVIDTPQPKSTKRQKPRKQKRPTYNPNAVREVVASSPPPDSNVLPNNDESDGTENDQDQQRFKDSTPLRAASAVREAVAPFPLPDPNVLPNNDDSDGTETDPDQDRLMDSTPLRSASARLRLSADLGSPLASIQDMLPSNEPTIAPIQPILTIRSDDGTETEAGRSDEEDYKVPDGVFLGAGLKSSDFPNRPDWLPMTTLDPDTLEEYRVTGTHPDYWLNKAFREMPVFDNIYDGLKALYPISDIFIQEEHFVTRPSIRLSIPDQLKSLLVDDWENVTKSLLLVPLPSQAPANFIIDSYYNEEKNNRRLGSADADLLLELCCGLKLYFEKAVGKILLYRFERLQLSEVCHLHLSSMIQEHPRLTSSFLDSQAVGDWPLS